MNLKSSIYTVILIGILFAIFFSCKKKDAIKTLPVVTITSVANITANAATSGGDITNDGGATVTARGVCWSTNQTPTTSDQKTSNGTGTGSFTSSVTELTPGTTYYLMAYATNSEGTAYSSQSTFTTLALAPVLTTTEISAVTSTSANSGGNISNDGGSPITIRGVCWSTSQNPTTASSKTSDGTGTGSFTSSITGLAPGAIYYFRAYATNNIGIAYGNQLTATATAILATITTTTASALTSTSATSGGNISSDGGATVTARGVCWSTSITPTITNSKTTDGTGAGSFASSVTGLTPGVSYYIRAYATNSIGTAYGSQITATTTVALPSISTITVSDITATTATSGGNITNDGGSAVSARGVCWSTSQNPTIDNSKSTDGTGTGKFTSSITGLMAGSNYYIRAFATNSAGTAYGNEVNLIATSGGADGTVTDIDGNVYHTVKIGTQVWMVENLRTTSYNDGTSIPNIADDYSWQYLYSYRPCRTGYCWFNNDVTNKNIYGALYNWCTVSTGKLAPNGWHVPTDAEWTTLTTFLGGESRAGKYLKEIGTSHWIAYANVGHLNPDGSIEYYISTNSSGFTALPGCKRTYNGKFTSGFGVSTNSGYWWSSTLNVNNGQAWYRFLTSYGYDVYRSCKNDDDSVASGFSVRCIKD